MMRKELFLPLLILLFSMITTPAAAQQWTGIIDPSRAVDWSTSGIPGGIPIRTTICSTLNPGATAAQINSSIASCPSNQVVFLNAGTYNLSSGLSLRSNVTLRGAGADRTLLVFTGNASCGNLSASVCMSGDGNWSGGPKNTANWTAGYAKGTTQITLDNVANLQPGNPLILDQLDDKIDGGDIYVCSFAGAGCSTEGGNAPGRSGRAQQHIVRVVAVSGNVVTISPGLRMPNWRSSQSPGAWWASVAVTLAGVENLSIDSTNASTNQYDGVIIANGINCWVKGIRSINGDRAHIAMQLSAQNIIRDSYLYGQKSSASQSYGIEWFMASDNFIENNIMQHTTLPMSVNGAAEGDVIGYNFSIDDAYTANGGAPGWMMPIVLLHESATDMILLEGNSSLSFGCDPIHGTHFFPTLFRNYFYGDLWNNPVKNGDTSLVKPWAECRFVNVVGNVLGRTGYYNTYQTDLGYNNTDIFSTGASYTGGAGITVPSDANVNRTMMRWANYDTVNGAARFVSAEVPSGISNFANPVPASQNLPPSFYLSGKPSWFGSIPWPPIGPDVTGGTGPAGHAYKIPAENCWYNVMHGAVGSSGLLSFNADTCYGQGAPPPGPAPPGNLAAVVN